MAEISCKHKSSISYNNTRNDFSPPLILLVEAETTNRQFASNHRLMLRSGSGWFCRYFVHDVLFKQKITYLLFTQSHHHEGARDWDDVMLNWTKLTCGFCSSITTATTQRANKLKKFGPFRIYQIIFST